MLLLALLAGCTEPVLVEVGCSNGIDDDGDGLIDCLDVDCVEQDEVCETTLERCRDGRDNDSDEIADCQNDTCVDSGFCDSFVPDGGCDLVEQTGCPVGMGCWVGEDGALCALAEGATRVAGEACDETLPVSAGCRPGAGCLDGICSPHCFVEADCPYDSRCFGLSPFCSVPCNPRRGADACADPRATCAPIQAFVPELAFSQGGGLFNCIIADPMWGTAPVGMGCSSSVRCAEGLVCTPDLDGFSSCREPCNVSVTTDTSVGCPDDTDICWPTYPSQPSIDSEDPAMPLIQGTCWPEGAR